MESFSFCIVFVLLCTRYFNLSLGDEFSLPYSFQEEPIIGSVFDFRYMKFVNEFWYAPDIEYHQKEIRHCTSVAYVHSSTQSFLKYSKMSAEVAALLAFNVLQAKGSFEFFNRQEQGEHDLSLTISINCTTLRRFVDPFTDSVIKKTSHKSNNGVVRSQGTHFAKGYTFGGLCHISMSHINRKLETIKSVEAGLQSKVDWLNFAFEASRSDIHHSNSEMLDVDISKDCDVDIQLPTLKTLDDLVAVVNQVEGQMMKPSFVGKPIEVHFQARQDVVHIYPNMQINKFKELGSVLSYNLLNMYKTSSAKVNDIVKFSEKALQLGSLLPEGQVLEVSNFRSDIVSFMMKQILLLKDSIINYQSLVSGIAPIEIIMKNVDDKFFDVKFIQTESAVEKKFKVVSEKVKIIEELQYRNVTIVSPKNPFHLVKKDSEKKHVFFLFYSSIWKDWFFVKNWFLVHMNEDSRYYALDCDDLRDNRNLCKGLSKTTIQFFSDGFIMSEDFLCFLSDQTIDQYNKIKNDMTGVQQIDFYNDSDDIISPPKERKCNQSIKTKYTLRKGTDKVEKMFYALY